MDIKIGDLVRIRGNDWLGKPVGIVVETKTLTHDQSGVEYTAVTALVGGKYLTFCDESFEVISTTERKEN